MDLNGLVTKFLQKDQVIELKFTFPFFGNRNYFKKHPLRTCLSKDNKFRCSKHIGSNLELLNEKTEYDRFVNFEPFEHFENFGLFEHFEHFK